MDVTTSAVLFSSARQDWTTPRWLFDRLHAEFGFTLDAAATPENALCPRYWTRAEDALQQTWTGDVFVNPPYSRTVGGWVHRGFEMAYDGAADLVVMLLASRTETEWFQSCAMRGAEIRFIKGRLHYGGSKNAAPFPSVVLVFDRHKRHPVAVSTLDPPHGAARGR